MGGRHGGPAYAIDDETAIKVTDGAVEVVSEGHWKLFTPRSMSRLGQSVCAHRERQDRRGTNICLRR